MSYRFVFLLMWQDFPRSPFIKIQLKRVNSSKYFFQTHHSYHIFFDILLSNPFNQLLRNRNKHGQTIKYCLQECKSFIDLKELILVNSLNRFIEALRRFSINASRAQSDYKILKCFYVQIIQTMACKLQEKLFKTGRY